MNIRSNILGLLERCYDEGESPSTYLDTNLIHALVHDESVDIRLWLAKAMVNYNIDNDAVSMLSELSRDSEVCVRLEAVDSLSQFCCQESLDSLCCATNDDDELIRAYAAFGIARVGKYVSQQKALSVLLRIAETERNPRVFVDIYEGLYLLGDAEALYKLIQLFDSNDYHVQCAVIHALIEIINIENASLIKCFVSNLDTSKYVFAVTDAIGQLKAICHL